MLPNSNENHFTTSDGTNIYYNLNTPIENLDKNKPLIVFNYGLVCSHLHFEEQIDYFNEQGYQVLIHDYRGHYTSTGIDDLQKITLSQIAQDTIELLNYIKHHRTIMIGHSMGVNVTLEILKQKPSIVLGQVLISGTVLPQTDIMFDSNITDIALPYVKWLANQFPGATDLFIKNGHHSSFLRNFIKNGGFNPEKVSDDFIKSYMQKIGELSHELFLQLFQQMRDHDIISFLNYPKTPSLIIGGDKDKIIPNHSQEVLRELLPVHEFYIVKDGSHVPQKDFPELINERIHLFIEHAIKKNGQS